MDLIDIFRTFHPNAEEYTFFSSAHGTLSRIDHILSNAGLEETQVRIKIAGRNINNLRYADDTTLMAESEEELKSLLMKDRKSTRLNSSHRLTSRMPSSA